MKRLILTLVIFSLFAAAVCASDKTDVLRAAAQTVTALKAKNMTQLAALVHPTKGVRFTAYNFVDRENDQVFKRSQIAGLWSSRKIYHWGSFDGSGDPIEMRFQKYYDKFVYDKDFARVRPRYYKSLKDEINMSSVDEAYSKAQFVEYYATPGKGQNEMDWAGLWLAYEKSGKKWYLVGVAHDEWTI